MQYIGLHNVNFGIPKDFGHIPKFLEIMRNLAVKHGWNMAEKY